MPMSYVNVWPQQHDDQGLRSIHNPWTLMSGGGSAATAMETEMDDVLNSDAMASSKRKTADYRIPKSDGKRAAPEVRTTKQASNFCCPLLQTCFLHAL